MLMFRTVWLPIAFICVALVRPALGQEVETFRKPVKVVAAERLVVKSAVGEGRIPLNVSRHWNAPLPDVTRALIVFHGQLRNVDVYTKGGEDTVKAAGTDAAGTLLIVPQFLAEQDIPAHNLDATMLRWNVERWLGGEPAVAPAPLSAFDAIDAILAKLADRSVLPNLKHVVVAGHSAGGQLVQRYAIVGRGEAPLLAAGVAVRYIVSNPSSYLYFSDERPAVETVAGETRADPSTCAGYNQWKYGPTGAPPYAATETPAAMEARYAKRDVTYLLGTADIDPFMSSLDKSCAGRLQGPFRYARGKAYMAHIKARNPETKHRRVDVAGIGHDGGAMFSSVCGRFAIFDTPGCVLP
jgi:pimeloyl-ACP methyl ester carboxylesterase